MLLVCTIRISLNFEARLKRIEDTQVNKHKIVSCDAEIVSISMGRLNGKPRLFLTYRIEGDFTAHTISLKSKQAVRLKNDINDLSNKSPLFQKILAKSKSYYRSFERIFFDHHPSA